MKKLNNNINLKINKKNFFKLLKKSNNSSEWIKENYKAMLHEFDLNKLEKTDKPLLEINDLTKTYGVGKNKNIIFSNLDFKIYQSEVISILGVNGAGKSTFLNIILNYTQYDTGSINYNYEFKNKPYEKIGVALQNIKFIDALTVWDYISFVCGLYKNTISLETIICIINIFDLQDKCKTKTSKLSGGQAQRLNILLSLIQNPNILILDEFSNNLDHVFKNKIIDFLNDYVKHRNIAIIFISHNPSEIDSLATHICSIKDKKLTKKFTLQEIKDKYKTIANYIVEYIG